ncbi:hypothetical protein PIB30_107856 [Stylosanthes scabra]|uniref:Uncharacterized protein n=1 Tax=Stylosanthes scabra TaxID=79078 RepID=A0ABU6RZ95_9FABA|nr:hypothetical protein [Stylosanthes scabra]
MREQVIMLNRELTQQAKEHKQEVQPLSQQHATQSRRLQSSFDTQSVEFDRWKSTVSQMYSFMQNMRAGSATSNADLRCLLHRRLLHRRLCHRFSTDLRVRQTSLRRMKIATASLILFYYYRRLSKAIGNNYQRILWLRYFSDGLAVDNINFRQLVVDNGVGTNQISCSEYLVGLDS